MWQLKLSGRFAASFHCHFFLPSKESSFVFSSDGSLFSGTTSLLWVTSVLQTWKGTMIELTGSAHVQTGEVHHVLNCNRGRERSELGQQCWQHLEMESYSALIINSWHAFLTEPQIRNLSLTSLRKAPQWSRLSLCLHQVHVDPIQFWSRTQSEIYLVQIVLFYILVSAEFAFFSLTQQLLFNSLPLWHHI